jgi:protein-L-isoaspartate O-methyltransferase
MIAGQRDLAACLGDYLTDRWKAAFEATPRHLFIPDQALMVTQGRTVPLDRAADPDAWIDAAYRDAVIVIQVDDGAGQGSGLHTSSCSMPQVVLSMLTALDVRVGQRVLEIGTGIGYSAALLAHRLGGQNVASVEVDPRLAEQTRANLRKLNRPVTVRDDDQPVTCELLVYDVATESAATVRVNPEYTDNGRFPVRQHGSRRLWDELETAHTWWIEQIARAGPATDSPSPRILKPCG